MEVKKLKISAIGLLLAFCLQFILGMTLNLFVTVPTVHPGDVGSNYFIRSIHSLWWILSLHGGIVLIFHVYMGILLITGSIALFVRCLIAQIRKSLSFMFLFVILFTIGAFFNGLSFIDYGHNISSFIMVLCWFSAVILITLGIIKLSSY